MALAGSTARRAVDANSGIVTLVGLADLGESGSSGNYQVRLVQSSDDNSTQITTSNVDVVGISLSVNATEYLQTYEGTFSTSGSSMTIDLTQDMDVFSVANISARLMTEAFQAD